MIQETFLFKDSFFVPTGKSLRDKGIKGSVSHANKQSNGWSEKALAFLEEYCKTHYQFSCEMVRIESKIKLPEPPSLRAWGSVLLTGSRKGWINQVGFVHVSNPLAHCANAALWESRIFER